MNKKNVAVLFGGVSSEHEVSKISAATVISGLSDDKYNIIPVYITKDGRWLLYDGNLENMNSIQWERFGTTAVISPDRSHKGLLRIVQDKVKVVPVDVVFPVLHGDNGEDGTVQGLLQLSGIPYVGCGVLASAVAMDKSITKIIGKDIGLKQAEYMVFTQEDMEEDGTTILKDIRYKLGYPCFVKPANTGSSIGISKARNKKQLEDAIAYAFEFDQKIIVEKAVQGRELECAVIGYGHGAKASGVGEIVAAAEFYDFDAKYNNAESKTIVPADIPEEITEEIRKQAVTIFNAMECKGLSRIDFFWQEEENLVYFNEANTIPGFTAISMFSMLWQEQGVALNDLLDELINIALA